MPNNSNSNRLISSHTLHIRHNYSILISYTHLPRRQLRLTYPIHTRKRSLNILHLLIPSCGAWNILWIIHIHRDMKHRSCTIICCNSNSIHRICTSMRTNILLRSHSNYQPTISYPLYRNNPSRVNLRGFSVDKATLTRFFAFHFILPFIITALVVVHLLFLHETGSNNPSGLNSDADKIPFHPYYTIKDILGILLLLIVLIILVLFFPDILGDPDNYTPANPLNTPAHIKPE